MKDPLTRRYFRLPGLASGVVRRFDGAATPDRVAAEVSRASGEEVTPAEVAALAAQLDQLALLDRGLPSAAIAARQRAAQPEPRSLLHLRRPLVDPDRFLARLARALGPLLGWPAAVAGAALVAAAAALHVAYPALVADALAATVSGAGLAWLYGATAVSLTVHELAHGVAARRLGAEVHEMGVMLLWFLPCAYTDVSDAWLLPRRRDRVAITLAGSVADLSLWGLATVLLVLLQPGPAGRAALGALLVTTGVRSVAFNLNPLFRLDGYYVLVDLLDLPNLRARSQRVVRRRVARWLGRAVPAPDEPPRDRRVLEAYGWLSLAWVALLLGASAVLTIAWLLE